ncbi:MAG: ferrochelatase [Acidobacteriota bacterium]|nr:ferrochelatase [Acidobacteriota bacterium]
MSFDALLLLSFGGPDQPEDVRPFLANVLRGRPVSDERVEQVVSQYMQFGGRSPINDQNRSFLEALRAEFSSHGRDLPVYWGNRNWSPYLADTVARMRDDGVSNAAVFVTSAYSSYSSCRQYLEDLDRARDQVGTGAPLLHKLRPYFNHPGFVAPHADGLRAARETAGPDAPVLMSAHSLPEAMAAGCEYQDQLSETAALVATGAGVAPTGWQLVFQSRSGTPAQPWLGPDVCDAIEALPEGTPSVIVAPIGFVSDHMEVLYDLDTRAAEVAAARGVRMVRSATPGTDARFVHMVCQLMAEIELPGEAPVALGGAGPRPLSCPVGCCPAPHR